MGFDVTNVSFGKKNRSLGIVVGTHELYLIVLLVILVLNMEKSLVLPC